MHFTIHQIDRIIRMAWEDRTTFEAIQFQIKEKDYYAKRNFRIKK
jgi:uncharacterized protein (TIGR03643 family)